MVNYRKEFLLNSKLEDIQHAYFCRDKNCPVCDGFYAKLDELFPLRPSTKSKEEKQANPGEIWRLDTPGHYPIYVLIYKDYGKFFRAVRASEFVDFATRNDYKVYGWLIECWNTFPVLKTRLDVKIQDIDKDQLAEIINKINMIETNGLFPVESPVKQLFQEIELDFQNQVFLEQDEKILVEIGSDDVISYRGK